MSTFPTDVCPSCGCVFDRVTGITERFVPKPGDVTICFSCGAVLMFGPDMRTEAAPPDVEADLPDDVQALIRHIRRRGVIRRDPQAVA